MPAAKYYRLSWISFLHGLRNLCRFPNHRSSNQGYCKAQCIVEFLYHHILKVRCDGGVDDANFVARLKKGRRNRQDRERRGRLLAGKSRKEKYYFFLHE